MKRKKGSLSKGPRNARAKCEVFNNNLPPITSISEILAGLAFRVGVVGHCRSLYYIRRVWYGIKVAS
jgi:hypothetical protein